MAGGNGTVTLIIRIPKELQVIINRYQYARRMPSRSQAVIELLETHPSLVLDIARLYDIRDQPDSSEIRTIQT